MKPRFSVLTPAAMTGLTARTVGCVLALTAGACGTPQDSKPPAAESVAQAPVQPASAAGKAAVVRTPTLGEIAKKVAEAAQQAPAADAENLQKAIKASRGDAKVLKALYVKPQLRFYDAQGTLGADGQAVLALLADLDHHGLDKAGYRLAAIDGANAKIAEAFSHVRQVGQSAGSPRAVAVAAAAAKWLHSGEGSEVVLAQAGGDQLNAESLRALDGKIAEIIAAVAQARQVVWLADLELQRAVVRYMVDMQLGRPAHPLNYTAPSAVAHLADSQAEKITGWLGAKTGKQAQVMHDAWPTHPQYALLLESYNQYKKLVDAGGWKPLPKQAAKSVKQGDSGPFVEALRTRLAAEGYDPGLGGTRFDEALREVVVTFQSRHQLDSDGVVSHTTVVELDVPAEQRLRQIQLALERLRESEGRDPGDTYIWVNIAFQKLWAVMDGKLEQTHRTVVGNNDTDTDQMTQMKGKINRTKMFSHKMTRVILAPRWYPTQRVVELEIQKHLATEPNYLEKHDYVREVQGDGTEVYYQKSGPENLLGEVKFQGPNKYNIYLHDTNAKALFARARRAYSHGCIRTQDPVTLADLVLGRDRGMSSKEIRDAIKEKEEKIVNLKTPLSVHIDYVSAAVDEDGNTVFGADVYGYDQAFFDGQLPVKEAEEYKAASVKGL